MLQVLPAIPQLSSHPSGSEANDLAVRLARVYTQKRGVVALQHAYHGTTSVCTGLSTCLAPGLSPPRALPLTALPIWTPPPPPEYWPLLGALPEILHHALLKHSCSL